MFKQNIKSGALALAVAALTLGSAAHAQGKSLRMASLGQSSPTTVFSIAVTQILKEEHGYSTQLSTGSPATRQAVEAANQQLDLFVSAVSVNGFLRDGTRMYKDMPNAPELFGNLRSILNYPFGAYHAIVWENSGITSLEEIKGKKVFIGPPSGAARATIGQIITGVTGYEVGTDFEAISVDWSSAEQAFQDHQIDVYFTAAPVPSAELQQLSALGKFRVLGIPDDKVESEAIQKAFNVPGREFTLLAPGSYSGLVNEKPVRLVNTIVGLSTNKWLSEEDGYNITKAIFENSDDLVAAAQWMQVITPENALSQMNAPLHIGAYKYYKSVGIDIPEDLIPPEAK
ncbi:TAXI family TRAP transporter solute-binding subunit [Phaeobacter sp. J2-8]|uniref:TAXI family TRAP transporter solute-binding subunit n=1 Tax=Phaeobacter sp. J2-8 TaxID=2931394 RepID=UPI001FD57592|nr:TAXI family TRAP transporter solute-binding subunit [Phaeobacter sp. J2-8]MCJ7873412.1 TAXI family TRAP transporter solute-binding subunit [Phaeobacter sp. J2-8]